MNNSTVSPNMAWYMEHYHVLSTMQPYKYFVIKDSSVMEIFDTFDDASKVVRLLKLDEKDYEIIYNVPPGGKLTEFKLVCDEEN